MKRKVFVLNFFCFILSLLIGVFLKLPYLAGVILLTCTIVVSSFLNKKKGISIGVINLILTTLIVFLYFKLSSKQIVYHQFILTYPLFLIGGYFAGKYNELRLEREKKLKEELEKRKILEIKIKKKNKQLREIIERQKKIIKEKTKELKEKVDNLEKNKLALLNILEDVDEERKRAEQEKEKTSTIIENFVDGLLIFDKKDNLILINPKAKKLLKIKENQILGRNFSSFKEIKNLKFLYKILGKKLKKVFRKEVQITKEFVLEVTSQPIFRKGEKIGSFILLHDISREKLIERMKTEFVSLAAHQLRTPLSAIKWTLKLFLDGDLGKITKEQREYIRKTYESNERMVRLVNNLLDVTRIEEGRYLYKPVLAEIEPLVQFVINSYQEEIKKRKINFKYIKPEKKLPKVEIDKEKMRLAIQNLLDNAIKYTPAGGQITISLKSNKKEIEFSIKDTGVGIPKDQQERVFTKFFRGVNVMKMETEGTGLGLFITKNIIEAHGGKIWFESKEGKGTTFYFRLPFKKEKSKIE